MMLTRLNLKAAALLCSIKMSGERIPRREFYGFRKPLGFIIIFWVTNQLSVKLLLVR